MDGKIIALRYPGVCAICGAELARGSKATWHQESRTVICLACTGTSAATTSVAGRSAERKARRLQARQGEADRQRSGLRRWLSPTQDKATPWRKGAEGEQILGARLNALRAEGMIVRHDLRVPGSRAANIDHVVVARSGIHVIDAKKYKGEIRLRDKGRVRSDRRLYVGSRDRTSLVEKLAAQLLAVDAATRELKLPTTVTPIICFVDGDWPMFCRGYELSGVRVIGPSKLEELLRRPGILSDAQMSAAGQLIFERLALG